MATTTNYGWTTPDDTALVKDGAAAIRTLGSSVDTTTKNLNPETTLGDLSFRSSTSNVNTRIPIGSSGQHLTVVAGVPAWSTASDQTPLTTKGDLLGFSTLDARIPIGANATVLTADSTESLGLKWAAPASASGPAFRAFRNTTAQSFSINTNTKVQLNAETFDTDNCFDSTTNFRFTPTKSGYYQFNASIYLDNTGTGNEFFALLYKNGAKVATLQHTANGVAYGTAGGSDLVYMDGSTDYVELFVQAGSSLTRTVYFGTTETYFSGVWIRS